eukprot:Awhi_evm2s322
MSEDPNCLTCNILSTFKGVVNTYGLEARREEVGKGNADCFQCRLVGFATFTGVGAYIFLQRYLNSPKSTPMAVLGTTSICLGISRLFLPLKGIDKD